MSWYTTVLKKYATFGGRAHRTEYWMFVLINFLISVAISVIAGVLANQTGNSALGGLGGLYALAVFLPSLAVAVRRLHDTDHSGWWLLIAFIPIIGALVLLFFLVSPGTPGVNRFGPDPRATLSMAV